jgi:hypothetical protein
MHIMEQYLLFVLELGWEPSEVFFGPLGNGVEGLQIWRDLFLRELQQRFAGSSPREIKALQDAMNSLDQGKRCVLEGYEWLERALLGSPRSN